MANAYASFTAPNQTGLVAADTGQPFTILNGGFSIKDNRGFAASNINPTMAVIDVGAGGQDATIIVELPGEANSGAQGLYFRVVDRYNWWRFGVRRTSSTYTYQSGTEQYVTHYEQVFVGYQTNYEYEWVGTFAGNVGAEDPHHSNSPWYHYFTRYAWSADQYNSPFGFETYSDNHTHGTPQGYSSHYVPLSSSNPTGNSRVVSQTPIYESRPVYGTRPVYTTTTGYNTEIVLDVCAGDSTAKPVNVEAVNLGDVIPTLLKITVQGDTIKGFSSASVNEPHFTRTDSRHNSATRHGFGWHENSAFGNSLGIDSLRVTPFNFKPDAPLDLGPADDVVLDANTALTFPWEFSDPDPADSQSKADFEYRLESAATWNVRTVGTSESWSFAAGALAPGRYLRRIRTYDVQGVASDYSPTRYFYIANKPSGLAITAPGNGSTIASSSSAVKWSVPTSQQAFRVLQVAADGTTVLQDSGEVVSTSAREYPLVFPVNNRDEQIWVQYKSGGLWSDWTKISVRAAFTPPPTPSGSALSDAEFARIAVYLTAPAPTGDQPAISSYKLERRAMPRGEDPGPWKVVGLEIPPNVVWFDEAAAPNEWFAYRVTAKGANGAEVVGQTFVGRLELDQFWLKDPEAWGVSRQIRVTDFPELDRPKDVAVYDVLGRSDSVISYGPQRLAKGTFTLMTHTQRELRAVEDLLNAEHPLVLLCPPETPDEAGLALWFVPIRSPHQRPFRGKTPARYIPVQFVEQLPTIT